MTAEPGGATGNVHHVPANKGVSKNVKVALVCRSRVLRIGGWTYKSFCQNIRVIRSFDIDVTETFVLKCERENCGKYCLILL